MKKEYFNFIGITLLLCLVPAWIYLASPNHDRENVGYSFPVSAPVHGTVGSVQQPLGMYLVTVTPQKRPLKTGPQILRITLSKGDPNLEFMVTMPMGSSTMTAPVKVLKEAKGVYKIETDFSMPGKWYLEIMLSNVKTLGKIELQIQ